MDLYQLSVVVSYCLLSEWLFKGTYLFKLTVDIQLDGDVYIINKLFQNE